MHMYIPPPACSFLLSRAPYLLEGWPALMRKNHSNTESTLYNRMSEILINLKFTILRIPTKKQFDHDQQTRSAFVTVNR